MPGLLYIDNLRLINPEKKGGNKMSDAFQVHVSDARKKTRLNF